MRLGRGVPGGRGLWLIAAVAFAVRAAIIASVPPGYPGDMAGWVDTTQRITLQGLAAAYAVLAPGSLYPPGFMYPLWAAGHLYTWCCAADFQPGARALDQVMLLGPILADSVVAVLVSVLARQWLSPRRALVAGLVYALCPAVLTTGAWQGMIGDPYYAVLVMAALLSALGGRSILAAFWLTLGVLVKPQALAFGPLVAVLVLKRARLPHVLAGITVSVLTTGAVLLPFVLGGTLETVWPAVQAMGAIHAFTQNSADNLWLLLQVGDPSARVSYLDGAVPDDGIFFAGLSYQVVGLGLFGALYLATLVGVLRAHGARAMTHAGAIIGLGFFFLNTRMHVNYMFMACPFVCVLVAAGRRWALVAFAAFNVACLVDWDALGVWAWPDGLPVHQASALLYGLSLVILCGLALVPVGQRWPVVRRAPEPVTAGGPQAGRGVVPINS